MFSTIIFGSGTKPSVDAAGPWATLWLVLMVLMATDGPSKNSGFVLLGFRVKLEINLVTQMFLHTVPIQTC